MKISRLALIGLLFAGSLSILIWGLNFLKGKNFLQPEKEYFALYERIGGLMISSPVTLNGFKVGDVRDIRLTDDYSHVLVKFVITYPELQLTIGSLPRIYSMDLMGSKAIQLLLGESTQFLSYGDTLSGTIEGDLKDQVNTQMLPLKTKAEDLMASMDSVLISLQLVFDKEGRSNLSQSFEIVTQTLKNVEQTSVFLDTFVKSESGKFSLIMNNIDSLSQHLVSRTNELRNTLINLGHFTDSLKDIPLRDAVVQFSDVLQGIEDLMFRINSGEGSLGKLVMSDSLYYSLEEVSISLNYLLDDIRKNPKRYVSLSAIDRGKTYVVSDESEIVKALAESQNLVFYACIFSTDIPLQDNHPMLKEFRNIHSIQTGKTFFYYLLETPDYDKARRLIEKNLASYPEAGVFTWINGMWTRIPF